ncbi:MAG: MarR family winged helix-turn-helix transcriptional regulator [Flavobacterium sp.]|jgi:DNA-binding MarR family transcriptional regulator|uniref:MarR family winged helix-turn-helix transcriptional regulator n=1 Tax=Flavobacterium sp. TaxID=239 RepID=UPI0022C64716|nr:MarR family transcriptional regulator [Flavobacterium sp.]MCZ8170044.1 MarR family transcriptional regulator [Flavobacterium sp.]MCZ8296931.1 MarR family transcriptional regulator [Flavobacterium sp.]
MKIEELIQSSVTLSDTKRVILNLMVTQNVVAEKFYEVLKPYDLSGEQYNVLRILRGQKGKPANMCVIQERMVTKNSNTTRLIDKLLLKDLVTRNVCPDNRRKMEVLITDKGLALLEELEPIVLAHEQLFAQNLNQEEIIQLNDLLEKFRTLNM